VVTDSGIGILPIYGALAQRAGEITPDCTEMTSYQRLGRTFDAMVADPDVRAILLEVDSPGGQVAGNFELGRDRCRARPKPVWAHANEIAFSGGYSLAAAAEKLYVPDTGYVGSIGVIMLHMSQAERDAKSGYKYTAIYAGAHKNDLNPHFDALGRGARAPAGDGRRNYRSSSPRRRRRAASTRPRARHRGRHPPGAPALEREARRRHLHFRRKRSRLSRRGSGSSRSRTGRGVGRASTQRRRQCPNRKSRRPPTQTEARRSTASARAVDAAKVSADARKAERARVNGILALRGGQGPPDARAAPRERDRDGRRRGEEAPRQVAARGTGRGRRRLRPRHARRGEPERRAAGGADAETASIAKRIAAHVNPKLS
jgi:hypothetical protein